ncbi:RagB/SusD family nutrient uptake outer membrane protein [Sphingobacterium pedocola]|uniref:RagB/SusD family nutrient uptake outer membrane protein n=1 Tax=Sphingobacterium pedocola TaxID=2082722 RepID=A0ABR9TCY6_9SPHI|nr:RagB/SusD family nutrient uptake outer membrane protein [Sphingobacterium pedocola]MBE8723206.1 RagB/SusD family nutrient uptake outer membrane protein [Sphingobacterium pedocola]
MRKYILILSTLFLFLASCKKNFLDVNSDSKYETDYVFSNKEEINRVLTAVYASLMSNDSYGNAYFSTFALNSDVEFTPFAGELPNVNGEDFRAFDGAQHAPSVQRFWNKQYEGIERANIFISGIENSPVFSTSDKDLTQMLGEAKVLRAMFYHDLVVMFGDVPFNTEPAMNLKSNFVIPVTDRNEILSFLINDLKGAAAGMKYASKIEDGDAYIDEGVERASKAFCYSMIARMALTRGGYALYSEGTRGTMKRMPDYKDYYLTAMQYADSVISSGTHKLGKAYRDVFIDQTNNVVNNNDDPIFEIPFLRNNSSNLGNITGPRVEGVENVTNHMWGVINGGMRLNAFYAYSFDRADVRKDYTVGTWGYDAAGVPQVLVDYSLYNNKWAKLWADPSRALGSQSQGGTGINLPYMRYADILLMYAEAVNEVEDGLSGPHGAKALDAFKQVRRRAFVEADHATKVESYTNAAAASKESFFNAIVQERKWEFGGENMRWKDLVRWNLYSKVVYDSFKEYLIVASMVGGDFMDGSEAYQSLPFNKFFRRVANPGNKEIYPNTTLPIIEFYNPWEGVLHPGTGWEMTTLYSWYNEDTSMPRAQILYSFRGFIKGGPTGNWESMDRNGLPPVRYILPFPNQAIQLSNGAYKNQYGY